MVVATTEHSLYPLHHHDHVATGSIVLCNMACISLYNINFCAINHVRTGYEACMSCMVMLPF